MVSKSPVQRAPVSHAVQSSIGEPSRSLYDIAVEQFHLAADILHLDVGWRAILAHCKRELIVNFPVKMDDGSITVYTGYRIQHNGNTAKGGLRYHQAVLPLCRTFTRTPVA